MKTFFIASTIVLLAASSAVAAPMFQREAGPMALTTLVADPFLVVEQGIVIGRDADANVRQALRRDYGYGG